MIENFVKRPFQIKYNRSPQATFLRFLSLIKLTKKNIALIYYIERNETIDVSFFTLIWHLFPVNPLPHVHE